MSDITQLSAHSSQLSALSAQPPSAQPSALCPLPLYACLHAVSAVHASTLVELARDFSPRFECHRDDLVSIDIRGLDRLLGDPHAIGDELRRSAAARGLRLQVAIAATRTAAMVLAHARPGLTVVERGGEAAALAPIPIGILEKIYDDGTKKSHLPHHRSAIDGSAVSALKRWGVKTLGELVALPAAELAARLGQQGLVWQTMARGQDVRPLVPTLPEERFESSIELEWPIEGLEPLSFVLTRLLEPLSTRLERRDRGAAALHVTLELVKGYDEAGGAGRAGRWLYTPGPPTNPTDQTPHVYPHAGAARAAARRPDAQDAHPARSRIASAARGDRTRHGRHRSDAGARAAAHVVHARAPDARAVVDAHRAADGADGAGPHRPARGRRFLSAWAPLGCSRLRRITTGQRRPARRWGERFYRTARPPGLRVECCVSPAPLPPSRAGACRRRRRPAGGRHHRPPRVRGWTRAGVHGAVADFGRVVVR